MRGYDVDYGIVFGKIGRSQSGESELFFNWESVQVGHVGTLILEWEDGQLHVVQLWMNEEQFFEKKPNVQWTFVEVNRRAEGRGYGS